MSFSDLVKVQLQHLESTFDESKSGVHILDNKKVCSCNRLYNGKLIDFRGKVLKSFSFKELGIISNKNYYAQNFYEGDEWGKFDLQGKLIWTKKETIHHEILISPKNTIFVFTKEVQKYKGRDIDFDIIKEYNQGGKELFSWSTWFHLAELQKYHDKLELDMPKIPFLPDFSKRKKASPWRGHYDYYRLNSLQFLPKNSHSDKRFQEGNWLISFRHGSLLFILDKDTKEIVWSCTPRELQLEGQHASQMLPHGNILVFDNGRYRGYSRIVEFNPLDFSIVWEYKVDNFFSESQGYVEVLTNGNFLITESEKGYAFEITKLGKKVWEFFHPDKQNATNSHYPTNYGKRQWLYRMRAV